MSASLLQPKLYQIADPRTITILVLKVIELTQLISKIY